METAHDTLSQVAAKVARKYGKRLWWADLRDLENEAWVGVLEAAAKYDQRKAGTVSLSLWCYRSACWWLRMYAARVGGPVAAPRGRSVSGGPRSYSHVGTNAGPLDEHASGSGESAESQLEKAQLHALAERVVREALRRADPDGLAAPVLLGGIRPAQVAAERGLPVKRVYSATSAARAALRGDTELRRAMRRIA